MKNTEIDTEQFIRRLKELNMTEEEKKLARAEELGEQIGKAFGTLIAFLLLTGVIWAILHYIFAIQIAWIKIVGGLMLFNLFKSLVLKPLLSK